MIRKNNDFRAPQETLFTLQTKSTNSGIIGFVYVRCTCIEQDIMNYAIIDRIQFFKGVAIGYNNSTMYLHICGSDAPIAMPMSGYVINIELYINELGEKVLLVYSRSSTGFNVDEIVIEKSTNNNYKVKRLSGFTNTRDAIKYMSNIGDHLVVQSSQDAVEITERDRVIIGSSSFTLKTHGHVFTASELFGIEKEIRRWFSTTVVPHENMYCASFNDIEDDYIIFFVYGGYKQFFKHYISKHTFTVAKYESVSILDSKFAVNEENIIGVYMMHTYNSRLPSSQQISNVVKVCFDGARACITSYDDRTNSYNIYVLESHDTNYTDVELVCEVSSSKSLMPDKALKVLFPDGDAFMLLEQVGLEQVHIYLARENKMIYEERNGYCKENVFLQLCLPQTVNLGDDFANIRRKYSTVVHEESIAEDVEADDMQLLDKEGSYGDAISVDEGILDDTDADDEIVDDGDYEFQDEGYDSSMSSEEGDSQTGSTVDAVT